MGYHSIPINHPKFEEEFPGWAALVRTVTSKNMILSGVQYCLPLSKQQIDYWIQKGILPSGEKTESKWRRFSILDVLLLAIASEFKSHGIEVSEIANIRELFPILSLSRDWTDCLVYIINGYEVFLYSDFKRISGTVPIEDEDKVKDFCYLRLPILEDAKFLAAVSLKKICDELAPKIEQPDFKVNVLPDGRYEFFNGVPLRLESLRKEDSSSFSDKLKGRTTKRRKKWFIRQMPGSVHE
jgi:DNA-binding transcriptional MerR regulator